MMNSCIVDSASHEMVLGKSVSDMIFEKKREMSVLAIREGWLSEWHQCWIAFTSSLDSL